MDCLEYADVYYEQKREWRNNKIVPTKTKKCLEFKSIVVTDVQGQKWTSQFGKPTTMMVFCILFFHLFRVVCCACFRDFSYRLCHCYSPPHPYVPRPCCNVTPRFSDEISLYLMGNGLEVARAMIQAGIQAAADLAERGEIEVEVDAPRAEVSRILH